MTKSGFPFWQSFLDFPLFSSCDEGDMPCTELTWYENADGDGLGNPDVSQSAGEQPEGYVADNPDTNDSSTVLAVDASYFTAANTDITITAVACTLSDGTETNCYQIVTNSAPTDHEMGPWCPDKISDDASAGGIWLESGEVYDVDGAFIGNMADFYSDNTGQMYDANSGIYVTEMPDFYDIATYLG